MDAQAVPIRQTLVLVASNSLMNNLMNNSVGSFDLSGLKEPTARSQYVDYGY